ncbi:hypothetical protein BJ165DRAFT_681961 [Panaeolus papilionaceus]|nr:hypothetical protein BJ165DRAFT_681961 [Panaeolus papilionaceus]
MFLLVDAMGVYRPNSVCPKTMSRRWTSTLPVCGVLAPYLGYREEPQNAWRQATCTSAGSFGDNWRNPIISLYTIARSSAISIGRSNVAWLKFYLGAHLLTLTIQYTRFNRSDPYFSVSGSCPTNRMFRGFPVFVHAQLSRDRPLMGSEPIAGKDLPLQMIRE